MIHVYADNGALADDGTPAHQRMSDVGRGPIIDKGAQRIEYRRGKRALKRDYGEVALCARLQSPEVCAAQRSRGAMADTRKSLNGAGSRHRSRADLPEETRQFKVEHQVMREAVCCDGDVDTALEKLMKGAGDSLLRLAVGAMDDVSAGRREKIDVGVVDIGDMSSHDIATEKAYIVEIAHGTYPVSRLDIAAFGEVLRKMEVRPNPAFFTLRFRGPQDVLGHRVGTMR